MDFIKNLNTLISNQFEFIIDPDISFANLEFIGNAPEAMNKKQNAPS